MRGDTVAGRLVTWALILFGAAEIPWVIFLAFTQQPVVQTFHVKLAALGLGALSTVLCGASAWAALRRNPWAPALGVAAATTMAFLATVGKLTPGLSASSLLGAGSAPLALALPGVVAGYLMAWLRLRNPAAESRAIRLAALVLAATAVLVAGRTVQHVLTWDSTAMATHTRAVVVILDTLESVGLLGAGLASRAGRVRATLVLATVAASLLVCDAYGNVVMAASGQPFEAALFYLVVGEVPSIALCALAIRAAQRQLPGGEPEPILAQQHGRLGSGTA